MRERAERQQGEQEQEPREGSRRNNAEHFVAAHQGLQRSERENKNIDENLDGDSQPGFYTHPHGKAIETT